MALMQISFFSDELEMMVNMDVIIPQKTKFQVGMKGMSPEGKYPTLYLLHGISDDHTAWLRRTSIERYVSEMGIAVVMPNVHQSFYSNMEHGFKYWNFVSEELPRVCRTFFPNMSEDRKDTFAVGLSMGGYGAFKLGLGAPQTFGAVASLSGALDLVAEMESDKSKRKDEFWNTIFGSKENVKGSSNDLFYLAEQLVVEDQLKPKMYIWCGTEDFLYEENLNARDYFIKLGYDVTYEESKGDHQWKYWDEKIQRVLEWLPIGCNVQEA
ncbi:MAG TPA: alpha/beta hydrolase family protein [Lachnospiraceae bacterium]|nr:alpha/beta hydrolase family protein [Lachnospiraceae bacterium]